MRAVFIIWIILEASRADFHDFHAQGTNDYELPHGYIESKPIVEELSGVSTDDDEPLVRTLCYEDALGVLPCSLPHSLPR